MAKIRLCGNTIEFNGYIVGTLFEKEVPVSVLENFKAVLNKNCCDRCIELEEEIEQLEKRIDRIYEECD